MSVEVFPARGSGALPPELVGKSVYAVLAYTSRSADRGSPELSTRAGDWSLACFVKGASSMKAAKRAAADWLGLSSVALWCFDPAGVLEVVEAERPAPPVRNVRAFDPEKDDPEV